MDTPTRALMVALLLTHWLALAVWVGAMLFNLVVNFPAQRARAAGVSELTSSMGAQASRAAPWLYLLMALVAGSGLGLQALLPADPAAAGGMAAKWMALALMAVLHGWGSRWLWPRIYFALESERPALFLRYQLAMAGSAGLGIAAAAYSFWLRGAAP
jgi:hypothetical protein